MAIVVDKVLGKALFHDHPLSLVSTDPVSGKDGQLILNTGDNKIKVWYASQWQDLYTLTGPAVTMGSPMGLLLSLTYAS